MTDDNKVDIGGTGFFIKGSRCTECGTGWAMTRRPHNEAGDHFCVMPGCKGQMRPVGGGV